MLNIALCVVIALSLTNALPTRNRSNEDFHDYAREAVPRKRLFVNAYLLRCDPSEGKWLYINNALKFLLCQFGFEDCVLVPSVSQRPITPFNFL